MSAAMDLDLTRITADLARANAALQAEMAERRRAEEQLQRQKEALQAVQERLITALWASATGTYRWDVRSDFIECDEPLNRLFGLPPGHTLSTLEAFFAVVHPQDLATVQERCRRCREEGADFGLEYRVVWPDGRVRWLDDRGKTIRDAACLPAYVTGACVDITERKKDQLALQQSEAFVRGVLESSADCIMILDSEGKLLDMNGPGRRLLDLDDLTAVRGRDWSALWEGPAREAARAAVATARANGVGRFQGTRPAPEGGECHFDVVVTVVHDGNRSLERLAAVARDVTETHRAQEARRQEEARFRSLAESGPQMVWMADAAGRYDYVNAKWTDYTGLSLDRTRDPEQWRQALHAEDGPPLVERLRLAYGRGEPFHAEVRLRRADTGVYRWFLVRAEPVRDEQGRVCRWIGAATDIDDQKRAEIALLEADRGKDEFLAMLAHELRNPLAPIRNAVQTLHFIEGSQQLRWAQDVIDRQVKHLSRLVDDLLDVSRITRGKVTLQKQPIDLAEVVAQAIETSRPLIEERRHHLEVRQPDEPLRVLGDPTRLAQVVLNLLNNAAKYTEEGGKITLMIERTPREAVVRIRDNGLGIPRDMLPRIFDLFTQVDRTIDRAQGGLGIGLMLVRRLVQMHGGSVTVASEGPGKGSEFTVRLPLLDAAAPAGAGRAEGTDGAAAVRRQRILVVDDNRDSADSLSMLLRLAGHEVRTAYDGTAGLAAARRWRPDVVLLDIGLPGLDGYEVVRRLRQEAGLQQALVVAMTGYGKDEDRERSQEAGFDAHLVKPVDPEELAQLIAALGPQAH
jgi:PAS domain S-box-containing protein